MWHSNKPAPLAVVSLDSKWDLWEFANSNSNTPKLFENTSISFDVFLFQRYVVHTNAHGMQHLVLLCAVLFSTDIWICHEKKKTGNPVSGDCHLHERGSLSRLHQSHKHALIGEFLNWYVMSMAIVTSWEKRIIFFSKGIVWSRG